MGVLAGLPLVGSLFAGGATAGTAAGAGAGLAGGAGALAGGTATTGAISAGSALGTAATLSGLTGTILAATNRPKLPTPPPTPQAPTITGNMTGAGRGLASIAPSSILGGSFTAPAAAAGSTSYGKTVLGG